MYYIKCKAFGLLTFYKFFLKFFKFVEMLCHWGGTWRVVESTQVLLSKASWPACRLAARQGRAS